MSITPLAMPSGPLRFNLLALDHTLCLRCSSLSPTHTISITSDKPAMSVLAVSSHPLSSPPPPPADDAYMGECCVCQGQLNKHPTHTAHSTVLLAYPAESTTTTKPLPPCAVTMCAACSDVDAPEDNPIVYCEICQCGVHAQCYGYPLSIHIPTNEWICQSCLATATQPPTALPPLCCLCPVSGGGSGLLKRTTCGRWCHISCALWIPEVFFRVSDGCDAIDVSCVSGSRYGRRCEYCGVAGSGGAGELDGGVCSECSEGVVGGCGVWYHITCGMRHGVLLEYRQGGKGREDVVISYCAQHAKQFRRRGKASKGQGR